MRLAKSIDLFLEHCSFEKKLSDKTLIFYGTDLRQFHDFLVSRSIHTIQEIDKICVKSYVQQISKFEPRTIKRKIASSKAYLNFLEFEDYIIVNPYRKVRVRIREPLQIPIVLEFEEIRKLFTLVKTEQERAIRGNQVSLLLPLRDLAIFELLFATGIRVSELCGIRSTDIDLETGKLLIQGKGNKQRTAQVCNLEALATLKKYADCFSIQIEKTGYFFVSRLISPLSTQSVRYLITKYCKRAGIRKNVTPHTFRHTFATLLLEQDVDIKYIQHLLGHSSINTTQIYTHVSTKKQIEILSRKHPRNLFTL